MWLAKAFFFRFPLKLYKLYFKGSTSPQPLLVIDFCTGKTRCNRSKTDLIFFFQRRLIILKRWINNNKEKGKAKKIPSIKSRFRFIPLGHICSRLKTAEAFPFFPRLKLTEANYIFCKWLAKIKRPFLEITHKTQVPYQKWFENSIFRTSDLFLCEERLIRLYNGQVLTLNKKVIAC